MQKTLFFIDDDDVFLHFMKHACKKVESVSKIVTASNGQEGLDMVKKWVKESTPLPDLMFVDINMPLLNGFEFLEAFKTLIREFPPLDQIRRILMLTSSNQEEDRKRAYETGIVEDYIVKSDDLEETRKLLRNLTSQ